MSISVYQWRVLLEAREDQDVLKAFVQISLGSTQGVLDVLKDTAGWDQKGLILQKVAEVEGDDFNRAFERTNSIDAHWSKNQDVSAMGHTQWRSTSVGDVMVCNGRHVIVSNMGFTDIPEDVWFVRPMSVTARAT